MANQGEVVIAGAGPGGFLTAPGLAGDAAHACNPCGGMGLPTG